MTDSDPDELPLLAARGVRIAVDDAVALERFDLESRGPSLLLLGDCAPLESAIGGVPLGLSTAWWAARAGRLDPIWGVARVATGSLELRGRSVGDGAHRAILGHAPLDPPLPPALTPSAWLDEVHELEGRLLGRSSPRAERTERVAELLLRVGLTRRAGTPIRMLALAERRALVLAQAALSDPQILLVTSPVSGLDETSAAFVLHAYAAVAEGRSTIVSASRPLPGTPEGALASFTNDVAVLAGGELVHAGPTSGLTASGRVVRLTIVQGAEALSERLSLLGVHLRGGPTRFVAELPEGLGATELLRAAAQASASVVEVAKLM